MTENLSFEKAFEELQKILEKMNSGALSLQDSLDHFEKAEKLMRLCEAHLNTAEQKIEQIIKGQKGEILLDSNRNPRVESFI